MPRVPIYDEPQVALRPLPNVVIEAPRSPLPELGESLLRTGAAVGDIARREQDIQNADRVFRAEAALKDEYLQFETQLRNRRGQDAWGVTDDVAAWWDEARERHSEALENDVQRFLFEQSFEKLRQQSLDSASRYEAQERRVSLEESARASIANSINIAASQHNNPEAIAGAKDDILRRIQVLARLNGWTPERVAAEEAERLTQLHTQVLQALIDADPDAAREYFVTNKNEIAGSVREELNKLIRVGGLRAKAQREVDAIMARGLSEGDAVKLAREKFEGEERDEIVSRIQTRYAEQRALDEQRKKELADQAWNIFARTRSVDSLPTSLLESLDGRTLHALRQAERGEAVETNWARFYELTQEAQINPEAFVVRDLRQDFGDLAPPERRTLINLQEQLRASPDDVATLQQQLSVAHNLLGLAGQDNAEKRGQFDAAVHIALNAEQKRLGRALTFEERQQVIDRMMIQGEIRGGAFFGLVDRNVRLFEVAGTPDAERFVPDIPDAERAAIEQALINAGLKPTDDLVREAYSRWKGL